MPIPTKIKNYIEDKNIILNLIYEVDSAHCKSN